MTLKEALIAYRAIEELMEDKMSFKDAHTLIMTKKALEPHIQFYGEKEKELVNKYGVKDEKGEVKFNGNQFSLQNDKVEDFMKERLELDSVEATVDLGKQTLHITEIKPATLEALSTLFEFE